MYVNDFHDSHARVSRRKSSRNDARTRLCLYGLGIIYSCEIIEVPVYFEKCAVWTASRRNLVKLLIEPLINCLVEIG